MGHTCLQLLVKLKHEDKNLTNNINNDRQQFHDSFKSANISCQHKKKYTECPVSFLKKDLKYRRNCVRYEKRYCEFLDLHPWLGQLAGGNGWQGYRG